MNEPQTQTSARPYHERWPEILRYPLHAAALSTIIAIAVAHSMVLLLLVVGPLLDLLVWAAFFKYAFEVLRWSANGRDEPPEISLTVGDAIGRYAVMLLILIELAVILAAISFGTAGAMLFGLLVATVMPAMVMILAIDEDLVRALNPLAWIALMIRLAQPTSSRSGLHCSAVQRRACCRPAAHRACPPSSSTRWPTSPSTT